MKTKTFPRFLASALIAALFLLFGYDAFAQDFTNNTNNANAYVVPTGFNGKIRMKSSGGQFNGTNPLGQATSPITRIPGTVEWGACPTNMTINPTGGSTPIYYTNLETSGSGIKTFVEDFHVSGTYTPSGGNRDYTTNTVMVYYDGTSAQNIAGENTGNGTGYYDLTLSNTGAKTVPSGATVDINHDFDHSGGSLAINGILNLGSEPSSSTADITIGTDGKLNSGAGSFSQTTTITNNGSTGSGGGAYVGTSTWNLTNFDNQSGVFDANTGSTINMSGSFTMGAGPNNIDFECGANFNYVGTSTQTILANGTGFPQYGNLTFNNAVGVTISGDVDVCNNFYTYNDADFYTPGDYTLTMLNTNGTGTAAYNTASLELTGKMKWENLSTSTAYTFNNTNTQITFGTAPTDFTLDVRPNTSPAQASDITLAYDIKRRIIASYSGTGVISNLQIAWKSAEDPTTGNINKAMFAEGWNAANTKEKLIRTGATYTRTLAGDPRYVSYGGGSGPGINLTATPRDADSLKNLASGSDILLTTNMKVISITNGRWSDPGTWDIGMMPAYDDDVEVRNAVWIGDRRALFGGSAYSGNERNGADGSDANSSANTITIAKDYTNAGLYMSNEDDDMVATAGDEFVFRTRLQSSSNIIKNYNETDGSGWTEGTSVSGFNGIWIAAPNASTFTPVMGTYTLENKGTIVNKSILEIGVCAP